MKNTVLFAACILALISNFSLQAQVDTPYRYQPDSTDLAQEQELSKSLKNEIEALEKQKALYESNQRTELAEEIRAINQRVEEEEAYTLEMAEKDKRQLAAVYADRIKTHNEMINSQIEFAKIKTDAYDNQQSFTLSVREGLDINLGDHDREFQKEITNTQTFTIGFGYSFMNGEQLGINDFSYGNNNYFSIGWLNQYALSKNQKWRFNYGLIYQSHGAELNGNRIFTPNTDDTEIAQIGFEVSKAKFRQDQLVVPLQLEFGGTTKKEYDDGRLRYKQWDHWKVGIGGFVGVNLSSRLKLKYEENGREIKNTVVDAFENEVFLYGLDAYIGKDNFTVFGRMNLNNVFKSGSVDAQYISFGIRFQ